MNKKRWNTIILKGRLSDNEITEFIDHSYELVFKSLTKKVREESDL